MTTTCFLTYLFWQPICNFIEEASEYYYEWYFREGLEHEQGENRLIRRTQQNECPVSDGYREEEEVSDIEEEYEKEDMKRNSENEDDVEPTLTTQTPEPDWTIIFEEDISEKEKQD